jgi:hypothetical protein
VLNYVLFDGSGRNFYDVDRNCQDGRKEHFSATRFHIKSADDYTYHGKLIGCIMDILRATTR